jgi:acetyltransferase
MLEKHYLDPLFHPHNIAIIGASTRADSVGHKVLSNLLDSQFSGGLFPVNPKYQAILDKPCFASVKDIPEKIDLAVITIPAKAVPEAMTICGECGIKTAVIISAGFSEVGAEGKALEAQLVDIAEKYDMHFIGPNCLGIMRPEAKLNASFNNNCALPGKIALVSQSGAICAAILDWAAEQAIGFSTVVSMGNSADLDFGDLLNYLAMDPSTKSILLYIEGVHHPRRFMSGLRAAARLKPVIVIKAGRHADGVRAVHSHTGALVGDDDVFSAAVERCGAIRVNSIEQLFTAAEILASPRMPRGNRLTIITNGGGAGVMAADSATALNIPLATLTTQLNSKLDQVLPAQWSQQNPIDILGDASPQRYRDVVHACLQDSHSDALLIILVPVSMSEPDQVAKEICAFAENSDKFLIVCWMGEKDTRQAKKLFAQHRIPCYSTPEVAVEAFSYLVTHQHNQQLLLQTPAPRYSATRSNLQGAGYIIDAALAEKRQILSMLESKAILHAMGIPISQTIEARSANEALVAAESLGYPVVMKIDSPDITHKQDVGGVQTDIQQSSNVRPLFNQMMQRVQALKPEAKVNGVTVEHMYKQANYRELMIGVLQDKVFGPVITLGLGGSLVEVIKDRAIALPPLNSFLAQQMIDKTKAKQLLGNFRGKPPVAIDVLINLLQRIGEMVCEFPQIQALDINPLLIDEHGAIAVDARIILAYVPVTHGDYHHMAICPYPKQLITQWQTADGTAVTIRPIRPEDAQAEQAFVHNLSADAKYFRFMHEVKELTPEMLVEFTQIDYQTEMALVATIEQNGQENIIGVSRYYTQANRRACEFALVVADAWQNKGLGTQLMLSLIDIAKNKGIKSMSGHILTENVNMLNLVKNLGFHLQPGDDATTKLAVKML